MAFDITTVQTGVSDLYPTRGVAGRKVAVDAGTGRIWACYSKQPGTWYQVYAAYSDDGGVTWTEEQINQPSSQHQLYPVIAIDSFGRPHVAWCNNSGSCVQHSYRDGEAWQAYETLDTGNYSSNLRVALASDANGAVHAAWVITWYQGTYPNTVWHHETRYCRWDGNWGNIESVDSSTGVGWSSNPSGCALALCVDTYGVVHLLSNLDVAGTYVNFEVRYACRSNGSWSGLTDWVSDLGFYHPCPISLAADTLGNVWAAWAELAGDVGDITVHARMYDGAWADAEVVDTLVGAYDDNVEGLSIQASGDGHPSLVLSVAGFGTEPRCWNVLYYKRGVDAWGSRQLVTDGNVDGEYPSGAERSDCWIFGYYDYDTVEMSIKYGKPVAVGGYCYFFG